MRSAATMVEEHTAAHTKASAGRNLTLSTHMSLYMSSAHWAHTYEFIYEHTYDRAHRSTLHCHHLGHRQGPRQMHQIFIADKHTFTEELPMWNWTQRTELMNHLWLSCHLPTIKTVTLSKQDKVHRSSAPPPIWCRHSRTKCINHLVDAHCTNIIPNEQGKVDFLKNRVKLGKNEFLKN